MEGIYYLFASKGMRGLESYCSEGKSDRYGFIIFCVLVFLLSPKIQQLPFNLKKGSDIFIGGPLTGRRGEKKGIFWGEGKILERLKREGFGQLE